MVIRRRNSDDLIRILNQYADGDKGIESLETQDAVYNLSGTEVIEQLTNSMASFDTSSNKAGNPIDWQPTQAYAKTPAISLPEQ